MEEVKEEDEDEDRKHSKYSIHSNNNRYHEKNNSPLRKPASIFLATSAQLS